MYEKNRILIAGIKTEVEHANYLAKPFDTGYHFIRKIDNFNFGECIYLGEDLINGQYVRAEKEHFTEVENE